MDQVRDSQRMSVQEMLIILLQVQLIVISTKTVLQEKTFFRLGCLSLVLA